MAVYFKFKSARDYDSIPIDGHFISVGTLKERIFESKHLGRGTDFDLMISNAQTDEEYTDDATLIPKNTSVLVRRIPGRHRKPIVAQTNEHGSVNDKVEVPQQSNIPVADSSSMKFFEEPEWDEFGTDLYAIPEVVHAPSNSLISIPPNNVEEESKLKALIDTPALDWDRQTQEHFGSGRGYGRGMGGRMMAGRGFGRGGLERKTPPPGYICHRCKIPGHFIQHCPTNGDPNYDIRRVKPPTGIPKSMLMATPDGSYALPSGAVAVLKPNEAAFEREIEGMPSTRPVTDLPPELRCPLCKEVMKDAVLTSKCCFSSFCDKCIRDYIISKSMCVCGFTNILADDLLPNRTLRETINRIMEASATSSAENAGSLAQVQDMESSHPLPQKMPSPTVSATEQSGKLLASPVRPLDVKDEAHKLDHKEETMTSQPSQGYKVTKPADVSEATQPSLSLKEPASLESAPIPEESQEKMLSSEQVKKKKKRKVRVPGSAPDMQWRPFQDMNVDNYAAMSLPPPAYNSYFPGMGWGMDGYMPPFPNQMPLMPYPQTPFDVPFHGMFPQDPFAGQGYMMPPVFPQRDLSEMPMGVRMNPGASARIRQNHDASKTNMRVNREPERRIDREQQSKDRGKSREFVGADASSKLRPKLMSQPALVDRGSTKSPARPSSSTRDTAKRPSPPIPPQHLRSSKRKSDDGLDKSVIEPKPSDKKQKASVFSRISFPDSGKDGMKKKSEPPNGLKETHEPARLSREERKPARSSLATGTGRASCDHDSSEEEYHFKRRPSSSRQEEASQRDEDNWKSRTSREQGHTRR